MDHLEPIVWANRAWIPRAHVFTRPGCPIAVDTLSRDSVARVLRLVIPLSRSAGRAVAVGTEYLASATS